MARIPYADPERPETEALVGRIVRERGSVLHLYAMLLHSGPVAEGWLRYLTAIRHECALPGSLRELVIMQIAHLNGAPYEAEQHAPIALQEGLTQVPGGRLAGLARHRPIRRHAGSGPGLLRFHDPANPCPGRHLRACPGGPG